MQLDYEKGSELPRKNTVDIGDFQEYNNRYVVYHHISLFADGRFRFSHFFADSEPRIDGVHKVRLSYDKLNQRVLFKFVKPNPKETAALQVSREYKVKGKTKDYPPAYTVSVRAFFNHFNVDYSKYVGRYQAVKHNLDNETVWVIWLRGTEKIEVAPDFSKNTENPTEKKVAEIKASTPPALPKISSRMYFIKINGSGYITWEKRFIEDFGLKDKCNIEYSFNKKEGLSFEFFKREEWRKTYKISYRAVSQTANPAYVSRVSNALRISVNKCLEGTYVLEKLPIEGKDIFRIKP